MESFTKRGGGDAAGGRAVRRPQIRMVRHRRVFGVEPLRRHIQQAEAFARHAGAPPDVIFECVGVPGMIQKAIDLSRTYGRIVVVGVCMVEDTTTPISAIFKEANIQYVLGYGRPDWRLVLDLLDRTWEKLSDDEKKAAKSALRQAYGNRWK